MDSLIPVIQLLLLVPVLLGSAYALVCLYCSLRFTSRPPAQADISDWPGVTILKPVCGLEKGLEGNLRSACLQDYPDYEVIFSVQDGGDQALPAVEKIQAEFPGRARIAVGGVNAGLNGKINNLLGAMPLALHEIMVISDSDARLRKDYLKTIVAPLMEPKTAYSCTLYKASGAGNFPERLELLSFNADFVPGIIFAYITGTAAFCLGSSVAFRRSELERAGGLEALSNYLVEDYQMGRRLMSGGKKIALANHFVDLTTDIGDVRHWWRRQVCWDQKTRAANHAGFVSTVAARSVPFAFLFFITSAGDAAGAAVLAGAVLVRVAAAGIIMKWALRDDEGLRSLALLPFRDLAALASWAAALLKKNVLWRGSEFSLGRDGKLIKRGAD